MAFNNCVNNCTEFCFFCFIKNIIIIFSDEGLVCGDFNNVKAVSTKIISDIGVKSDAVNVSIDYATEKLLELTGEKAREAVVNEVFSKFCVGK